MGGTSVTNAIPGFYYFAFGIFEPVLALAIFVGIVADPLKVSAAVEPLIRVQL